MIQDKSKPSPPNHIAIIMDGNGRWAQERGESRTFGHQNGIESVREAIKGCREVGVKFLTLYAFSTENWNRPEEEVAFLMNLLVEAIEDEIPELIENDVKLETIGDISILPKKSFSALLEGKKLTAKCKSLTLILALNYGSKFEITTAIKSIAKEVRDNRIEIDEISETLVSQHLYTKNVPDPEIVIRTSNEKRISNFLLWQIAYSELFFLPIFWPEFRKEHLFQCITEYQKRERRYGMTGDQIKEFD